jgi:hydroxylysine kinase
MVLDPEPPSFSLDYVREIAQKLYAVTGDLKALRSERDQIFGVRNGRGEEFVIRISGPGETPALLNFQNRALSVIESKAPQLPVPRVCKSVEGRLLEFVETHDRIYGVRLFTFISGEPVQGRHPSGELYRDMGRFLAALDNALNELGNAPADQVVLWNMNQASQLRLLIRHVEDPRNRRFLEIVFDRFEDHIDRALAHLRSQVIHNDFTPKNVLIDPRFPDKVCGVIDFGDLAESPLVVDLGVAVVRHIQLDDALDAACQMVSAYHSFMPLQEQEVAILYDVMCTRLAMRAAIWSWRKSVQDARFNPGHIGDTFERLALLLKLGEHEVSDKLHVACREPRHAVNK